MTSNGSLGRTNKDVSAEDVREIARAVQRVCSKRNEVWVSWRSVAKEAKGSEEFADLLSCIASMETWKRYFASPARKEHLVKLTTEGMQFIVAAPPPKRNEIGTVADAVRQYATRLRRISLTVNGVAKVKKVENKTVHAVSVDASEEAVASETPCEFRPTSGGLTRGRVIGQEPDGGVLYVAFDHEVSPSDLPAVLSIDRAFLLQQLASRLRELRDVPPRMAPALHATKSTSILVAGDDSLAVGRDLATLPTPWTRFLWGPPGAGKTYGIGYFLTRLQELEPNGRTLIVAPSNRAVDVALEQFLTHLRDSKNRSLISARQVLRFGYPKRTSLLERPELLGPPALDELSRKVRECADRIARMEREQKNAADIAVVRAELLTAQDAVKNAVTMHVKQCAVVATTSTLAYLPNSPIGDGSWDNVIVDEVTMVTPAMCTFLASLATKRFLLAGDPRQLGPVYEASSTASDDRDAYEWMGRDIFDKSGISRGEGELRTVELEDARLARITSQRRCASPIWSRVAYLYPKVENKADLKRAEELGCLPPCEGSAVVLLDTSACGEAAKCSKSHSSWQNAFTADLAIQAVHEITAQAPRPLSIAIIAPYRAQVRLLRQRLRQEMRSASTPLSAHDVDAGTIHQFQGSDADVIIFDMVDGAGRSNVGNLLKGDAGLRLVNVAFTRAKGKLVIIADADWCAAHLERTTNPLLYDLIAGKDAVKRVCAPTSANTAPSQDHELVKAENLLRRELWNRSVARITVVNYPCVAHDGTEFALANIAFPQHRHAVFIDGRAEQGTLAKDRGDSQQRHRLTDLGWTFSTFRVVDILADVTACADRVQQVLQSTKGGVGKL